MFCMLSYIKYNYKQIANTGCKYPLELFYSHLAGLLFGAALYGDGCGSFFDAFYDTFGGDGCDLCVGRFIGDVLICVLRGCNGFNGEGFSSVHSLCFWYAGEFCCFDPWHYFDGNN